MLPCFEALESAWSQVETQHGSVVLADMKIEIGQKNRRFFSHCRCH